MGLQGAQFSLTASGGQDEDVHHLMADQNSTNREL